MMIDDDIWKQILDANLNEKSIKEISKKNKIPMSFIVGRLAKNKNISYTSKLYREYFVRDISSLYIFINALMGGSYG